MRSRWVRRGVLLLFVIAVLLAVGWWNLRFPQRLPAVPPELMTRAVIPGIPGARYFVAGDLEPFVRDVLAARQREEAFVARTGHTGEIPPADLLAVSGGGDNGAFGAGLLCGWSASGKRPRFKAVTGISTGALIAPFAFLGPDYDDVLRTVYTSIGSRDIAAERNILAVVNNDGMADNSPLWELISKFVDAAFLAKIAEAHAEGRLLLIGTTNIDVGQPVIWNMGAIAASGSPGALDLFRSILLASAAIPGAFPPTMMRVEVDGKPYDEMHVDGGASAQVFLYPPSMRTVAKSLGQEMTRTARVFVIRNSSLVADWVPVERRTISIAQRAIASLITMQGIGDLYRIYLTSQQDGLDFNLVWIGSDFHHEHREQFDTIFMKALFDYGFRQGEAGGEWKKMPPGLNTPWNG